MRLLPATLPRAVKAGLVPGLIAVLIVTGYAVGRHVWAEVHGRKADAALQRSLHVQGHGALTEARRHLAAALTVWPDHAQLHFRMAQAARREGDLEAAAASLRRAEQLGWVPAAIELERTLAVVQQGQLGRLEPALLDLVQRSHPDKLVILEALIQGCRRSYRLPQALAYLDAWLDAQPQSARALAWRGETKLLLARAGDALDDYDRAVELNPGDEEARLRLADLLLGFHRAHEAREHYTALQQGRPDSPEVLCGLARCWVEQGEAARALPLLERVLALHPRHAGALLERGKLARAADQPQEAEKWLRQAVTAAPFEPALLAVFHDCLVQNGLLDEAAIYQSRIDAVERDRNRLDALKKAIIMSPHQASLRLEVGQILLRNGQDEEALRWLQSALREDPGHQATLKALEDYHRKDQGNPTKG